MAGLRWGIMGAGGIARRFARSLGHVEGASLVALSGRSAVRLDSFAAEFPVDARRRYVSAEDGGERAHQMLVDDPDVDAVYLSLPHGMHERWACRLLRAGKAVLCEKPAVLSAEEAGRVVSAARESGSLFVEAMKPRFMPVRARVRELLASGELGEIRGIEVVHRLDYGDLEGGYLLDPVQGGTLYDLGCYGVAWAENLLGGAIQVDDVRTRWMVASDGSAVDIADEADLRIGGVPVHFDFAGDAGEYRVECRVTCERGEVSIPMLHRPTGFTVHRFDGPDSSRTAGECIEAPLAVDDFYDEISHTCELIRRGESESPIMPLSSTVRTARIIDAVRAAWREPRERVGGGGGSDGGEDGLGLRSRWGDSSSRGKR